jgi:hypothetical protein
MRCTETTKSRLLLIQGFLCWQQRLIAESASHLDPAATEFDFKSSLPSTTTIDGTAWLTTAHGVGARFVNSVTGIVVDAHVGFLDSPTAIDAWRLVQYCESLNGTSEDFDSWQDTLETLAAHGIIDRHTKIRRHYTLNAERVSQLLLDR